MINKRLIITILISRRPLERIWRSKFGQAFDSFLEPEVIFEIINLVRDFFEWQTPRIFRLCVSLFNINS